MQTIAIWGAAGNMGTRACARLAESGSHRILTVEPIPAGVNRLRARGDTPADPDLAARSADIVLLAIADKHIPRVAEELAPAMKAGSLLLMLDPAAAFAGAIPERADVSVFVTHPTHPPVFNDETDPAARRDYFGSGLARQSIVSALVRGPEEDYDRGERVARALFHPVLRSHRVTLEQMALLEPAMPETCSGTFIVAMREAMEEVVARGVPRQAALDFLLGHINVQLAIVFEQIDWKMSEGAYRVIDRAMRRILRPDWKGVFDVEEVRASVRGICGLGD